MIDAMAMRLKALGNPQRLQLFELIRSNTYCCYVTSGGGRVEVGSPVGDLAREFNLAASTVSHHLKELRTAELIEVERRGQFLYCRVREDVVRELLDFLAMKREARITAAAAAPPPRKSMKKGKES